MHRRDRQGVFHALPPDGARAGQRHQPVREQRLADGGRRRSHDPVQPGQAAAALLVGDGLLLRALHRQPPHGRGEQDRQRPLGARVLPQQRRRHRPLSAGRELGQRAGDPRQVRRISRWLGSAALRRARRPDRPGERHPPAAHRERRGRRDGREPEPARLRGAGDEPGRGRPVVAVDRGLLGDDELAAA